MVRYLLFSAASGGVYLVRARTGELLQFFDPGQGVTGRVVAQGPWVFFLGNGILLWTFMTIAIVAGGEVRMHALDRGRQVAAVGALAVRMVNGGS